ncbi:MAG: histone deacetylase family protein [Candidatus Helarchaeota archaeon]|nr:histone deacetylase family protein [Candidatus Helarchaeota archaeon]
MKIIFHKKFYEHYTYDPAAASGRLEPIVKELKAHQYEFITPEPATEADILRAHTQRHLDSVKSDRIVHEMALLAAGGAIKAAQLAWEGTPTFAIIRPPGHHASGNSCWGFCYFNNISVSLLNLREGKGIQSAFVLDFDLHTGDGNINILGTKQNILRTQILNPRSNYEKEYLEEIAETFNQIGNFDIIVASAGFDEYEKDWGGKLSTSAYNTIGKLMNDFSEDKCQGRRYALLEGGYYHADFGINVHAFCQGFE